VDRARTRTYLSQLPQRGRTVRTANSTQRWVARHNVRNVSLMSLSVSRTTVPLHWWFNVRQRANESTLIAIGDVRTCQKINSINGRTQFLIISLSHFYKRVQQNIFKTFTFLYIILMICFFLIIVLCIRLKIY